jgi:ketosteroid isomerase-like protein
MYRWFIRRQIRAAFAALSRGDGPEMVSHMSDDVHHVFPGRGPLGGERRSRTDVATWFDRLFRLLPGLQYRINALAVDGPPWDTRVGVEWTNLGPLRDGSTYRNTGAHVLRLRNGRIVSFHAYLHDHEASAPPIVTPLGETSTTSWDGDLGSRGTPTR